MDKRDALTKSLLNDLPLPEGPMTDQSGLGLPAPIPSPPKNILDNIVKTAPQSPSGDTLPSK